MHKMNADVLADRYIVITGSNRRKLFSLGRNAGFCANLSSILHGPSTDICPSGGFRDH